MWIVYNSKIFKAMKATHLVKKRFVAITLAEWILTDRQPGGLSSRLILHERRHVWQWRRHLYVLFPIAYGLLAVYAWWKTGEPHRDHPYGDFACEALPVTPGIPSSNYSGDTLRLVGYGDRQHLRRPNRKQPRTFLLRSRVNDSYDEPRFSE